MRTIDLEKAFRLPARPGISSLGWTARSHPVHDVESLIRRFGARPETVDMNAVEKKVRDVLKTRF